MKGLTLLDPAAQWGVVAVNAKKHPRDRINISIGPVALFVASETMLSDILVILPRDTLEQDDFS